MNIKQCKEEIKNTVMAYLAKDELGNYKIPVKNQRPILVIGPAGIGKTAIMEQIAKECHLNLVSYTVTHHTRQSAIGLPKIEHRTYENQEYDVTEYTMSEIVASVYEQIKKTGIKEGILFLDEINSVSETLAPTMLQFLQCKMFGNHKLPEGFIIITAGNPPEYNKSVREFDVVTLDRVKKLDLTYDYEVWKEYAYKAKIHSAILSYLDLRLDHFYQMESTVDGKRFVTARGWEDLSIMILTYEQLSLPVTREMILGYIQHDRIAKDFATYYELYRKYQEDYKIEGILSGDYQESIIDRLKVAPFDEKVSVIGLCLGKLAQKFIKSYQLDSYMEELYLQVKKLIANLQEGQQVLEKVKERLLSYSEYYKLQKESGLLEQDKLIVMQEVIQTLERYLFTLTQQGNIDSLAAIELIKSMFGEESSERESLIDETKEALENGFGFLEVTFGESQEMVIFLTELTANYYSMRFIHEYGCDSYFRYNKGLLFHEKRKEIQEEIKQLDWN